MARTDLSDGSLVQLVTCSVCKEVEDKLKILPCHQPVCLPCTCKISVNKHHRYTCPLCDKVHLTPNGGFKYLPDSLVSLKLSARKQQKEETTDVAETTGYEGEDVVSDFEDEVQTSDDEGSDNMLEDEKENLAAESVDTTKTPESVDTTKTSESVDTTKIPESVNTTKTPESVDITKTSESVDTTKTSESVDTTKTSESVDTTKTSESVNTTKTPESVDTTKISESVDTTKTSESVDTTKTSESVDNTKIPEPVNTTKISESVDTTKTSESVDTTKISESVDTTKIPESVNTTKITESVDTTKIPESVDTTKTPESVDTTKISESVDTTKTSESVDTTKIPEFIDTTKISVSVDTTKTSQSVDTTKTPESVDTTKISESVDTTKTSESVNTTKISESVDTTKTSESVDTTKIPESVDTTETIVADERDDNKPVTPDDVDLSKLREEMDEQLRAGKRWQKRAEELVKAQTVAVDYIPEVSKNTREAISVYQQKLVLNCQQKLQGISKGLCERKAELENSLSFLQPFVDQMKDAVKRAPQLLKRLADDDCEAEDRAAAEQLLDKINGLNKAIALSEFGKFDKCEEIKAGDSVRLRFSDVDDVEDFVHGKVTHTSIGILAGVRIRKVQTGFIPLEKKTPLVIFPEQHDWEGAQESDIVKSITKANMPYVGDRVRIKGSVVTPHFSWRGVRAKKSRGILNKIDLGADAPDGEIVVVVNFPEEKGWRGLYSEIELLPGCGFEVGDEVRVNSAIPEPSRGWAGVNGSSVGKVMRISGTKGQEELTINFPECKNWIAMATELELIRKPTIGDKVQIKLTVKTPKHGWVGVNHEDVGELVRVDSGGCMGQVNFPNKERLWSCKLDELEPARYQTPDYGPEATEEEVHAARMLQSMLTMGGGMSNIWGREWW